MTRDRLQAIMYDWLNDCAQSGMMTDFQKDNIIVIKNAAFNLTYLAQHVLDKFVEDL